MERPAEARATVFTIGHSTRPVEELIEMLRAHGARRLIDVRTIPKSRYNPQYNREALEAALAGAGIAYEHRKELGGLRHARADSMNTGWRNESFRGYADYMQTAEFSRALEGLVEAALREPVAVMCAEAVPWRCHRSLISDALTARGHLVEHIMGARKAEAHRMTSFALVEGTSVRYPGESQGRLF